MSLEDDLFLQRRERIAQIEALGFRGYTDFNVATRMATELRVEALRIDPSLADIVANHHARHPAGR